MAQLEILAPLHVQLESLDTLVHQGETTIVASYRVEPCARPVPKKLIHFGRPCAPDDLPVLHWLSQALLLQVATTFAATFVDRATKAASQPVQCNRLVWSFAG